MTIVHRASRIVSCPTSPSQTWPSDLRRRGGEALEAARALDPDALVAEVLASGLRGRGGAGFPTGVKWRTVRDNRSTADASTVVVNGAEGESGTFKDRTILRRKPSRSSRAP